MPKKSLFPPATLEDALVIANTIWQHNAGRPTRRLTIFDSLERQPDSSTSRTLITASSGYGLTKGGYQAEIIELTDLGRRIVENGDHQAKLEAAIGVELFRDFYDTYKTATLPAKGAALDFLQSKGVPSNGAAKCLEIILANGREVGLIRVSSGKERILSIEHVSESYSSSEESYFEEREPPRATVKEDNGPDNDVSQVTHTEAFSPRMPDVHIDIQIHISADAKSEQIDQIFASMAKHLYGSKF